MPQDMSPGTCSKAGRIYSRLLNRANQGDRKSFVVVKRGVMERGEKTGGWPPARVLRFRISTALHVLLQLMCCLVVKACAFDTHIDAETHTYSIYVHTHTRTKTH